MLNTYCIQQNGVQRVQRLQEKAANQRFLKPQTAQTHKSSTTNLYQLLISIFGKKAIS